MTVGTPSKTRVVIVGAGYAGLTAAHRLSGKAVVTVVSPGDRFVDRIRLHQFATGGWTEDEVAPPLSAVLPSDATHIVGSVRAVSPGHVHFHDGSELTADHIIVAAGSGVGAGVTNLESSREVKEKLSQLSQGATVRIDGAGHTGVELSAELAEQRPDLHIVLVDPLGPLPLASDRARRKVRRHLKRAGVTLGTSLVDAPSADLTIDCTGFRTPVIDGVSAPDDTLSFGEGLWAAGDIADTGHRWSCAAAEPMGAHVADNILRASAGKEALPLRFGFAIQCVSLGRRRGVVQTVTKRDEPRRLVIAGRPGGFIKERISRMARRIATGSARRYTWPAGPPVHEARQLRPPRPSSSTPLSTRLHR